MTRVERMVSVAVFRVFVGRPAGMSTARRLLWAFCNTCYQLLLVPCPSRTTKKGGFSPPWIWRPGAAAVLLWLS
jgi:hypothetical protein